MSKEIFHPSNQEMLLSAIWESSIDAMRIVNKEGITFKVNNAYCTLTGFERKSLIGKPFNIVYDEKSQESILKEFLANFQSGKILGRKEEKATCKTGKRCHIELSNSLIEISGEKFVLSIIRDITEFMQVVDSVSKNEEKYKNLYRMIRLMCDNATDMIWAKDLENRYIFANKAMCQNLFNAKDTNEPVGKTDMFFAERERKSHRDEPEWHTFGEICRDSDTIVLNSKQKERFDEFGNVQGKFLFLDVYKTPLLDEQGNIIGTVGSGRDVTQEKLLEEEYEQTRQRLIESEEKFHTFANFTYDWEYWISSQHEILYMSPSCEMTTGYSYTSFIEDKELLKRIVHPDDKEIYAEHLRITLDEPIDITEIEQVEFRIITKSGETRCIHHICRHIFSTDGRNLGRRCSNRDITEKKQAELALIEERGLFIGGTTIIFKWKAEEGWPVEYVSQNILNQFGYTVKDFMSNKILYADIIHPDDIMRVGNEVKQHSKSGIGSFEQEYRIVRIDGEYRWIYDFTKIILDNNGNITHYLGYVNDITERKQAEEQLRNYEISYKSIFDSVLEAIYIQDEQGRFLDVNLVAEKMYGYTHDFFIGKTPEFLSAPGKNDFEKLYKAIKESYNGVPQRMDFWGIKKDGTIFPKAISLTPGMYLGKKVIITVARDITERKKAEEDIIESEETFRKLFDESTDPILLLNKTGFTDCNQATVINLGYSYKQEFLNKQPWELSPEKQPDGRFSNEKAEAMIAKALQNGYNRFEWIHTKSDGTDFPVEVMLTPITLKGEQFFYTIWRDITERKQSEDELRKLSRAVEQSPVTIIITDINSEIVYANPKATEITGYPLNELLGKNTKILKSGLTEQVVYNNLWDTISSGKIWRGELLNRKKNGELYWEYVNISPIMNNDNIVTHYLAVKEDITVRKNMQEELIKAKEQAEKMNKLKDAFIANISHEIRTPLNGILGMTQLIQNSFSQYVPENNDNYFDAIRQASTRIIRTVDMILNFSRMQIGEFPVSIKPVSLSSILDNLIKEYSSAAESKSLELSFENRCGHVVLILDEYSIIQAISNLLDNALKYSEKGFVKLILYADEDNQVKLDIQDSGIGISDDYIHQIFDPYSQEETGYSRAYEGVGLGLSLVKKYLDINGADISVASNKGEGTTFTIHFRKDKVEFKEDNFIHEYEKLPAKPPNIRKERVRKPLRGHRPSILVVEDDGINQLFIMSLLKNDYETVGSHNANEAIKLIKKQPFDLILMDISLKGGMNGLELTKLIRGTIEFPFTPIIAITGHSSPEDRQNCLEAGCNEFISKPFMDHELLEKIDMFIKKDE